MAKKVHYFKTGGTQYGKGICGEHGYVTKAKKKVSCKLCKRMLRARLS